MSDLIDMDAIVVELLSGEKADRLARLMQTPAALKRAGSALGPVGTRLTNKRKLMTMASDHWRCSCLLPYRLS